MAVEPIRDFIVVTKDAGPEKSAGGIYMAHVEDKNVTGVIQSVGTGRVTMNGTVVPLDVKAGDRVLFNRNLAVEVKDGDNTVLVLREDQVICVIR